MRVIMLGTAAAIPDPDRNHSSILITIQGRHYLFDCGHGATHQLIRENVIPGNVNVVFLSHLHYDHIADFPFFLLTSWITDREEAPVGRWSARGSEFCRSSVCRGCIRRRYQGPAEL